MVQVNRYSYNLGEVELIFDYGPDWETGMLFEAVFFQYKMLLGEFGDGTLRRSYEGLDSVMQGAIIFENLLNAIYFFGTTFFTQLTILNMLIAIMAATY